MHYCSSQHYGANGSLWVFEVSHSLPHFSAMHLLTSLSHLLTSRVPRDELCPALYKLVKVCGREWLFPYIHTYLHFIILNSSSNICSVAFGFCGYISVKPQSKLTSQYGSQAGGELKRSKSHRTPPTRASWRSIEHVTL